MTSRRRATPGYRTVRRLIPLVVLAIPGDYHRQILPGLTVLNDHKWADVCTHCDKVARTTRVKGSRKKCGNCKNLRIYLPLYDCPNKDCAKKLVYSSQAKISSGITCKGASHDPNPRFTGTPKKNELHSYEFERNE